MSRGTEILARWSVSARNRGRAVDRTRVSQVEGWIDILLRAPSAPEWIDEELAPLIALEGRSQGLAGLPPSALIADLRDLERASEAVAPDLGPFFHDLIGVAADSHALGQRDRLEVQQRDFLAAHWPIVPGARAVMGFVVGAADPQTLDGFLARLFRATLARQRDHALVDVSGADLAPADLEVILGAFPESSPAQHLRLTVTGLDAPMPGAPAGGDRLRVYPDFLTWLDGGD